ncbi:MAG: ATP-binding protein [Pseudonocardiaceae bacterium]
MNDMLPNAEMRLGNARDGTAPLAVADLRYDDVPAVADQLPRIRHMLTAWAQQVGLSADDVSAVVLATYEAMANVVSHAYPHRQGTFDVHAVYSRGRRYVKITVVDRGCWRPPTNPVPPHGMGLQLIHGLAVDAVVDPGVHGTTVRLGWPIPGDSP